MNRGCRLYSRIQSVTQIFSKTYAYPYINMHGEKTGAGGGGKGKFNIFAMKEPETRKKGSNRAGRNGTRTSTRTYLHAWFLTYSLW